MQTLTDNIKIAELVPLDTYSSDLDGSETPVDCYGTEPEHFDSGLVLVDVGAVTGTPDSVTVEIVEGDASDMSDATTIKGGDAVDVTAGAALFTFQVTRTKRYIGVKTTTTNGTDPTTQISATVVQNNWATPYPVV